MKTFFSFLLFLLTVSVSAVSFEPPEIPGWEQDGDVKKFDKDNLFNHINGAAEFYFNYNFQELQVVRYSKDDAEIILEVYDHGDPVHAYGIYSMERPPEADVKEIGAEGYYEETILNCVADRFYIKMNSYREEEAGGGVLLNTAREVTDKLSDKPRLPRVIQAMPTDNLEPNSRQFVSKTFMGHNFLESAYRASYETEEGKLTMFVIERKNQEEVLDIIKKYHEFIQSSKTDFSDDNYEIEDPFNGTIHLNQVENFIIGFSGDNLKTLRKDLLEEMKESLGV